LILRLKRQLKFASRCGSMSEGTMRPKERQGTGQGDLLRSRPKITRELRPRSAVEPVIGHLKSEHLTGGNYLWHRQGDAISAVLAVTGYKFRRLIRWLELLVLQILVQLTVRPQLIPS
jgi:hypothetical protein